MGRLFGTDGIRGIANRDLSAELAQDIGRALAIVLREKKKEGIPCVFVGRDTRVSGCMLEAALVAGLTSAGVDVVSIGVLPTPAVSLLTAFDDRVDAGIMISASHNPYQYNGIKIFGSDGYKLTDGQEQEMEEIILDHARPYELAGPEHIGRSIAADGAVESYTDYLAATVNEDLSGLRILADCANGSSAVTAKRLFEKLGVEADVVCAEPDGKNINDECGSTHVERLCQTVIECGYDAAFAFDGDADRCLAVDDRGNVVDGDQIMAVLGLMLREEGRLPHNTIVATVMSNLGLFKFAEANGINIPTTKVGDRYVLEAMREGGFALGGENSGHVIFGGLMPTGDGQLTAVQLLRAVRRAGKPLSELASCVAILPQVLLNVDATVDMKNAFPQSVRLAQFIHDCEIQLGAGGRILIRPSGTEPLIRVMVEGEDMDKISETAQRLAHAILKYLR